MQSLIQVITILMVYMFIGTIVYVVIRRFKLFNTSKNDFYFPVIAALFWPISIWFVIANFMARGLLYLFDK